MSISESKNEGKAAATGQSAEENVAADIEKALNFLDSEEYQDVGTTVSDANFSTEGINAAQAPQQKDSTAIELQHKKVSHPHKIEKEPAKKASTQLEGARSKKSGKIWLLSMGMAILVFLAILLIHKMV